MCDIKIGNKSIGKSQDVFLCAEVGTTCNGDLKTAKDMIDVAAQSGLDALKFQVINPDKDFSDPEMTYTYTSYDGSVKTEKMMSMLSKYIFTEEEWIEIKNYGDEKNVLIFATPSHLEAVDLMEKLNMPAYKICSWNVNFYPLIRKIAKTNKPVLIDTGPASDLDLMKAIDVIKNEGNNQIILLYCHHTNDLSEVNLNSINYLKNKFNCLVGYSSGGDSNIDLMSLAYKPVAIELRLTMDRTQQGHHHGISLNPSEAEELIKNIKKYKNVIGECTSLPTKEEMECKDKYFRSIYFVRDMECGAVINESDIVCKRPAQKGLDPYYFDVLIGRKINTDVKKNDAVTWDNV